jgi:hypothetical protein
MALLAALLLDAAPTAQMPSPPSPAPRITAVARATVMIVRAERVSVDRSPDGAERRVRRTPQGLLIEFD